MRCPWPIDTRVALRSSGEQTKGMGEDEMASKVETVIEALGMHGRERMRSAVLAANGSRPLRGLSATESAEMRSLGVTGANGGLTTLGANVRAAMVSRALDEAFA